MAEGDAQHQAVDGAEGALTYLQLDARANQLARLLIQQGIGAGDVIGLLFDKSVHSHVSMLAVLKVNAAYVPLDAVFPADRIAYIVRDSGMGALLTLTNYFGLAEGAGVPLICIDQLVAQMDAQPDTPLESNETAPPVSELCYVIYTSGSTGRPKGVPIEHASICNFVRVAAEVYGYEQTDRVYQGLTMAFDFAVEEVWVPLVVGAALVPNQTGVSLLGSDLCTFARARGVTAMCCVPTLLATLEDDLPALRLLIVSGEACPRDLVRRWHRTGRRILNAYGPTETTVTATIATLMPEERVTIGRPLPTYSIVILTPGENQALARGEVGEIGIAGIGVAAGYLNREEQTRQAFIPDFLGIPNNPSGHIYRTGDLGRIDPSGQVEYLGRIDTQVKIRGYRIELTEIESVIMHIPQVAQAVVNTWESAPGATELVAYYTLHPDTQPLSANDVARELRARLPGYMVPAYCEHLASIPMLASDKADRKALPLPHGTRLHSDDSRYVAPIGALESTVCQVLGELLQLDRVSVEDHFFDDLGANSLLMARFNAKLRKELQITNVSMRDIYLQPSVRKLAGLLASLPQQSVAERRDNASHVASGLAYGTCGALQVAIAFAYLYFQAFIFYEGFLWTVEAVDLLSTYLRATVFGAGAFVIAAGAPVLLKWLLIGRWKEETFPVWGIKYLRFWAVRLLTRLNPMVAFVGSPLYVAYLRLLGAKVAWNAVVLSPDVPVCTDLVSIGERAVITKNVMFAAYKAESNRVSCGRIDIGRNTFIGEATVLDIGTVMEDGSQLGHASSLQTGQRLTAGRRYHGSPAQETQAQYRRLPDGDVGIVRRLAYSTVQLASLLLVYVPLPMFAACLLFEGKQQYSRMDSVERLQASAPLNDAPLWTTALGAMSITSLVYAGALLAGLAFVLAAPRLLNLFIAPDRTYPLYGFHYFLHRHIHNISNSNFYNTLFGDSSFVVHYLSALGYRFNNGIEQTGTNFGQSQQHDNPLLCEFGRGTMVSDGLALLNAEYSCASFRLSKVSIGAHNFIGNSVFYPPQGKTAENCLLATKAMIPIDGPMRSNVGLLGSPCFEIPRSVRRDSRFDDCKEPQVLARRLAAKNASNALTILFFVLSYGIVFNLITLPLTLAYVAFGFFGALFIPLLTFPTFGLLILHHVFVDWASRDFKRLQPRYCSIYDPTFWRHERYWKLGMSNDNLVLMLLNGTPFKGLVWRMLGVRVGRQLFDDGCSIPEKTLVSIGDHCTLGNQSLIQGHSLEDGTFKSDRIVIGDGCTIGGKAFVHYSVEMGDDVCLDADSFLMKGERPAVRSHWRGNPAKEVHVPAAGADHIATALP
ncbi:Pls/PosA family non-ribosomal peptide synthetase [Methylibium sp.]|uniref:Pls/PosA family non-ribosomal peptide synthetase n=1 Tax=Methylibium sp. TaxID=2067992 RepID=UPI0025F79A64|nr:Pls/PosA family non-ribosomal peptide synthetase [Methylibium sp.]